LIKSILSSGRDLKNYLKLTSKALKISTPKISEI
jgi:hypothetical protein